MSFVTTADGTQIYHKRPRIKNARLVTYPGAPHGITDTHKEQLGQDLLAFLKEYAA